MEEGVAGRVGPTPLLGQRAFGIGSPALAFHQLRRPIVEMVQESQERSAGSWGDQAGGNDVDSRRRRRDLDPGSP